MSSVKIIHVIPYIGSEYGGPPYVAKSLNDLFNEKGFKSIILTVGEEYKKAEIVSFKLSSKTFWFSFNFMLRSNRYIKNCDIVFVHGLYSFVSLWSSLIAFIFGKKIFLLPHGMLDKHSINSSNFIKNMERKIFLYSFGYFQAKISKRIIFNSKKEQTNSTFNKNSIVIPNGVDLGVIERVKCDEELFNNDKVKLFYLGRINPIKGVELIIDAVNNLEDDIKNKIELVIAGSGRGEYVRYIQNKSEKSIVRFVGHIDEHKKYCYLRQCDIYLQPSFTEGLSISMLEALACRVNMITTNRVGLYEELIYNDAAEVINYDKNELKTAIEKLIIRKINHSSNGYKIIRDKYNWDIIFQEYKKLFKERP